MAGEIGVLRSSASLSLVRARSPAASREVTECRPRGLQLPSIPETAIVATAPTRTAEVSDGPLVERLFEPFRRFAHTEAAGGISLLAATAVALIWANSPWSGSYHGFWAAPVRFGVGGTVIETSVHHLINDGLMAVFFFLVGLEIKREILAGDLSTVRSASLPIIAAAGGMILPAVLFAFFTVGTSGTRGWGIPMATDIAFALGILALVGDRVPRGLKVFLAALAIADDIGAILVIALFYSEGIVWTRLMTGAAILMIAVAANLSGARRPLVYGVVGIALWATIVGSGVHATVAGVLLAMTIPVRTRIDERAFLSDAKRVLDDFATAAGRTQADPETTVLSNRLHHASLREMESLCDRAQPPLIRFEYALHGAVAFGVMPLFALANAGVSLSAASLVSALREPVMTAVMVGLLIGKPLGIAGLSWIAIKTGIATLPRGVSGRMLAGAGMLGGIGFTMSLFVAGLAFGEGELLEASKVGIMIASLVAGVSGWLLLSGAPKSTALEPGASIADHA
jgi:NhaA family Na+:H+ antiporter